MWTEIVSWIAVVVILLASCGLIISRDWRWSMGLLAIQYIAAAWLVARHWPLGMASVKLVTGWMATAALGMTRLSTPAEQSDAATVLPRGRWFQIFLAGIVALLTAASAPAVEAAIPGLGLQVVAGGLLLAGMGLVHLGITSEILRVILGLLTLLSGFEVLYAGLESSILVAGLLALVNLGLALAGSYLMMANASAETPAEEVV
ncbi:MAG: hypothetical protein AB1649_01335 [Chloroflexota bacterium]